MSVQVKPILDVDVRHIISVDYDIEDDCIRIHFGGSGPSKLKVPDGPHQAATRRMWLRKLRRVAPFIPTNEFCTEETSHQAYLINDYSHNLRKLTVIPTPSKPVSEHHHRRSSDDGGGGVDGGEASTQKLRRHGQYLSP